MKKIVLPLLLVFLSLSSLAQFSIDAQLRSRFEMRDGYQKLPTSGSTPMFLISQRTRLSFTYENDFLKLVVSPQDVRLWGGDATWNSTGVASNIGLGLFEGYAELKLGKIGSMSVGRQQLKYDNEKIFSLRNWNQNGMAYDALLFKLKFSKFKLHVGSSWNSLKEASVNNYYPSDRIKSISLLWFNYQMNDNFNASLLHVVSGTTKSDTSNTFYVKQTTGLYATYKNDLVTLWGDGYYQYGKSQKGLDVSAFIADLDVAFKIHNFSIGVGGCYLSGNKNVGSVQTHDNLFDPLYGARHAPYGQMDYFSSFGSNTKQGGLIDGYLNMEYKFSEKYSLRNMSHYFQLAERNQRTLHDKMLGFENDLVFKAKFNNWCALECGYMFMLPTATLKNIQGISGDRFSQFFYTQLTFSPTIFNQKNK